MQHPATQLIVDAHLDMAYNALVWKRNYRRAARWTRAQEEDTAAAKHNGACLVGLPDLIRGRVGLVFGTIFTQPKTRSMSAYEELYSDAEEAHAQGMAQFDFYRRWAEEDAQHIRLVTDQAALAEVCQAWGITPSDWGVQQKAPLKLPLATPGAAPAAPAKPAVPLHRPVGIVPLMENADPIREPKELEMWYEKGLRIVGPAWDTSRYAGGTWSGGRLSKLGHALLDMIAEFNVILDVSHLSHASLFEALDVFEGRHIIASHCNAHRFVQTERQLPDEAIEQLAARKGVIGVVPFNKFLKRDWSGRKADVTLDDVIRMIDHICQVTGSADHVGIGSDFDGGFGAQAVPQEIDTIRDLHKIGEALLERGFSAQHVTQIMHGNWLRVLAAALPS